MTYWESKRGERSETSPLRGAVGRVLISLSFKTSKRPEEGPMSEAKPGHSLIKGSQIRDGSKPGLTVLGLRMDDYLTPIQVRRVLNPNVV